MGRRTAFAAPPDALKLLLLLCQFICDTGEWPEALRLQEVIMIPRGLALTTCGPFRSHECTVTRALEKMLLSRYRSWLQQVQETDVASVVLSVDTLISEMRVANGRRCFRKSDKQLAISFGVRAQHAATLFDMNRSRPAIIRAGSAVGALQTPSGVWRKGSHLSYGRCTHGRGPY